MKPIPLFILAFLLLNCLPLSAQPGDPPAILRPYQMERSNVGEVRSAGLTVSAVDLVKPGMQPIEYCRLAWLLRLNQQSPRDSEIAYHYLDTESLARLIDLLQKAQAIMGQGNEKGTTEYRYSISDGLLLNVNHYKDGAVVEAIIDYEGEWRTKQLSQKEVGELERLLSQAGK